MNSITFTDMPQTLINADQVPWRATTTMPNPRTGRCYCSMKSAGAQVRSKKFCKGKSLAEGVRPLIATAGNVIDQFGGTDAATSCLGLVRTLSEMLAPQSMTPNYCLIECAIEGMPASKLSPMTKNVIEELSATVSKFGGKESALDAVRLIRLLGELIQLCGLDPNFDQIAALIELAGKRHY